MFIKITAVVNWNDIRRFPNLLVDLPVDNRRFGIFLGLERMARTSNSGIFSATMKIFTAFANILSRRSIFATLRVTGITLREIQLFKKCNITIFTISNYLPNRRAGAFFWIIFVFIAIFESFIECSVQNNTNCC